MRTEHLRALMVTAQLGSISQAGRSLHINQQQLSKIIHSLEEAFGCPIFDRSPKGVTPTEAGQDILATVQTLLAELDALQERLKERTAPPNAQPLRGTLTIHAPVNVWPRSTIVDILDAFISAYPSILVQFDELSPYQTAQILLDHPDHIGFIVREKTHVGQPLQLADCLVFLPLYESKVVAFAGEKSDFFQKHHTTSLKALQKEPFVVYRPDIGAPVSIDAIFAPLGGYNIQYSVGSQAAFYDILRKGKAVSVGIQKSGFTPPQGVSIIPIRDNILVESGLLIHKDHLQDPLVSAFHAFYLDYCRQDTHHPLT